MGLKISKFSILVSWSEIRAPMYSISNFQPNSENLPPKLYVRLHITCINVRGHEYDPLNSLQNQSKIIDNEKWSETWGNLNSSNSINMDSVSLLNSLLQMMVQGKKIIIFTMFFDDGFNMVKHVSLNY